MLLKTDLFGASEKTPISIPQKEFFKKSWVFVLFWKSQFHGIRRAFYLALGLPWSYFYSFPRRNGIFVSVSVSVCFYLCLCLCLESSCYLSYYLSIMSCGSFCRKTRVQVKDKGEVTYYDSVSGV